MPDALAWAASPLTRARRPARNTPHTSVESAPSTCTVLVVPAPKGDYIEPAVNAIKTYVENGGRALIMLDPVFDFARESSGENAALIGLLTSWGATPEKNLVLDENPVKDVNNLKKIRMVILNGEILDREKLLVKQ